MGLVAASHNQRQREAWRRLNRSALFCKCDCHAGSGPDKWWGEWCCHC